MDLATFILDAKGRLCRERTIALAAAAGTSTDYLYQLATKRRRASPKLALLIAANSPVTKESLRDDIWPPKKRAA